LYPEVDINSDGTVVFAATFNDGTEAILTTDPNDPGATLVGEEQDDTLTFDSNYGQKVLYEPARIGNDTLEFFTLDQDVTVDGLTGASADQVQFSGTSRPSVDSVELRNDVEPNDQGNEEVDVIVSFQGGGSLNFADLLDEDDNIDTLFDDSIIDKSNANNNNEFVEDGEIVTITGVSDFDLQTIFGDSLIL
jgi:hypothetical protein